MYIYAFLFVFTAIFVHTHLCIFSPFSIKRANLENTPEYLMMREISREISVNMGGSDAQLWGGDEDNETVEVELPGAYYGTHTYMNIYMYVYIYVCMYVHIKMYVCLYACTYRHTYVSPHQHSASMRMVYTDTDEYIFLYVHTCEHIYICIYTCIYMFVKVYIYTYICICVYIYEYI